MKKQILKIFVCSIILLIGIGAVNALDNDTNEFISLERGEVNFDDEIEVLSNVNVDNGISDDANEIEVLSAENNEEIDANGNNNEILGSQIENDDQIAVSDDEVLSADNGNKDILAISNDGEALSAVVENESEVLGSSELPDDVPVGEPTVTHSSNLKLDKFKYDNMACKELVFAKVKITKKNYKRFILKTPSKKNKKLWKKYKKFRKAIDKKLDKSYKKRVKAIKKKWKIDWYYGVRCIFVLKGKYCTMNAVCMCYRWI